MARGSRLGVLILLASAAMPIATAPAQAQVFVNVSVRISPPPLPIYEQPPLPGPDYIWLPGYWAWDDLADDYFWVPGTWVLAPRPGYVWTPPWWGWSNGAYIFHSGYWGPHIGWYGGIVYGFGYTGFGYEGGFWRGPHYVYNRAVTNITNVHVTNVYNKTVIVNRTTINNVSFNGGPSGVQAQPTPALLAAAREPHLAPTAEQQRHIETARGTRQLFATANHGAPPVAATLAPARFNGPAVVRARAGGGPPAPRPTAAKPPVVGQPTGHANAVLGYPIANGRAQTPAFADHRPLTNQAPGWGPSAHVHGEGRPESLDAEMPTRPPVAAAPAVHHPAVDRAPPRPPAPPRPQPRPEPRPEAHRPPAPHPEQHEHRE